MSNFVYSYNVINIEAERLLLYTYLFILFNSSDNETPTMSL